MLFDASLRAGISVMMGRLFQVQARWVARPACRHVPVVSRTLKSHPLKVGVYRREVSMVAFRITLMTLSLSLLVGTLAHAQAPTDSVPTGWRLDSRMGLQLQQSQFSSSWQGDEQGAVAWAWTWNSEAQKQMLPWLNWLNTAVFQFGQTHQQSADRSAWEKPRKSTDKITYRGLLRFTTGSWIEPFVALDFDTQFYAELDSLGIMKSAVLTPATLRANAGIARTLHETESRRVITRLGFGLKTRVDRLHFDSASLAVSTRRVSEAGLEWFTVGRWTTPKERAIYESEVRFFKAFVTSAEHTAERAHWSEIDIDWQNSLSTRVTSFIEFVLFWQILYEAQDDLRGQFKQTLGAGLTWDLL